MLVISSREFREKQRSYLDKVDEGMEVLIRRGKNKSYKVTAVSEDDTLMSKEEFMSKIDRGRDQYQHGQYTTVHSQKEMDEFFERL
jgi:hypothetical protein